MINVYNIILKLKLMINHWNEKITLSEAQFIILTDQIIES